MRYLIFNIFLSVYFMDHFEKKEQDYTKWDQNIWLSVEKEISQFQSKVTDCMLGLGQLKKQTVDDFKVEPCLEDQSILGQQFYLELIRPACVKLGYLPKQVPTQDDLKSQDSDDSDEQSEQGSKATKITKNQVKKQQKVKQPKKGGKKGSKNNQGKNDDEKKLKIVKQNFNKDFDMVLNSQSLQRMQIQFGLKQKKLQVKLITFFYVAFYIRKNKEKQKMDESQVFQLINILLKIVRIFDGFKGKSFYSTQKGKKNQTDLTEISPTLIIDLKMCIKGLKQFYKYTNKKIIINYPKLVYYTNYDRFFPTLDIKPYPSQIQFIQAIKKAFNLEKGTLSNPTLILYKTMIGSGKTSASLSLSNLINQTKLLDQKNVNYQVLYCCLIGSVRVQVGRYAYNKNQKFALAAMQKSIMDQNYYYPRIINSYSCRNEKIVDLIISDLDCAYSMFDKHHYTAEEEVIFDHENKNRKKKVNVGQLDKQNIILFIDQPTAFCKDVNSVATRNLFKILANYPPKLIILASATMPVKEQLTNTIKLIEQRNPGLQVYQIDSKEFQIGCQYSSFKGDIIFPHTNVKSKDQLSRIINIIDKNPFLMRLYTGPSLYFLLKKCETAGIKNLPKIDELPEVKQQDISKMTIKILNNLLKYDDSKIEEVCKLSADEANLDYKIVAKQSDSDDDIFGKDEEQEKPAEQKKEDKPDYVNFKSMLRQDAHKFLGGCLIATENPLQFAQKYFAKWLKLSKNEYIKPVRRLLEKYQRDVQALQRQIKLLEDEDKRDDTITKQISKLQTEKQPKMEFPDHKKINTVDHYNKYCRNKEAVHASMLIKPIPIELVAEQLIQEVDDFVLKLLFCGVALYMQKGLSSKYLDKVQELASQNFLAYIITDQSLCYGTNFPISNVILCDDLACKLNMNEMFQLIGRAGRVGQSWTARAFLQDQGLKKLSNYISSDLQKMSDQAEVFQAIAQEYLDDPELTLRTTKSQIKYVNIAKPDDRIQIIIKKKNKQDYHIFRKVSLVPYLEGDKKILTYQLPFTSVNYYQLAQSDILYEDMPTKLNSHQSPIIDVQLYFKNQQQFIRGTLNNAVKRILKTTLQGKISVQGQVNQFKPKVYEDFFCNQTNTFAVLVKCKQDIKINNFKFNKVSSNAVQKLDDVMKQKIDKFIQICSKLAKIVRRNPGAVLANDVKEIKQIHQDLLERPKTKFYKQIFNYHHKEIHEEYQSLTSHIQDKTTLENPKQSQVALFVDKYFDFRNVQDKWFHIDQSVRKIWQNIVAAVQK